jgi:uncharacterized protein YidB (DUF937 family)
MALLDDVLAQAGGVADVCRKNPALVAAAVSLLSSRQGSLGPQDGLGGLIGAFQNQGMGDVMSSWISTGANKSITPAQLESVLGRDTLSQFGRQAGVGGGEAGSVLAALLPSLINGVTPKGELPQSSSLEGALGSLLGSLGR